MKQPGDAPHMGLSEAALEMRARSSSEDRGAVGGLRPRDQAGFAGDRQAESGDSCRTWGWAVQPGV